jgi:hypothetical protein
MRLSQVAKSLPGAVPACKFGCRIGLPGTSFIIIKFQTAPALKNPNHLTLALCLLSVFGSAWFPKRSQAYKQDILLWALGIVRLSSFAHNLKPSVAVHNDEELY